MPVKKGQETLKRHKKVVSSSGAFRSTLRAEKETQCSGAKDLSFKREHDAVDEASRQMEQKPWNKLDRGYRIRKICDWVDELNHERYTDDLKGEIRNTLVRAIQRKEITTNACVEYDVEKCKVTGVPALMLVDDELPSEPDISGTPPENIRTTTTTRVIIRRPEKKTKRRKKATSS